MPRRARILTWNVTFSPSSGPPRDDGLVINIASDLLDIVCHSLPAISVVPALKGCTASLQCRKPHPRGFFNDPTRECKWSSLQIQRYVSKISGPLLDRIDIHIDVPAVKFNELASDMPAESSSEIRVRVVTARRVQLDRFSGERIFSNAQMSPRLIRKYCAIDT
jgi:hypothetical protein